MAKKETISDAIRAHSIAIEFAKDWTQRIPKSKTMGAQFEKFVQAYEHAYSHALERLASDKN